MTVRVRTAAGSAGQALAWSAALAAAIVVVLAVLLPRVTGATPYAVLSGSMAPAYEPGALVVVRPVDAERIATGTPITFQLESGRPEVATHRVVGVGVTTTGELRYTTRGDANGAVDPEPVRPEQVRGAVWYSLPLLGHVSTAVSMSERELLSRVAAGGLLAYAAWALATGLRDRRTRVPQTA